jgi:integrase
MAGRGKNVYVFPGRPRQPLSGMAMAMRRMGAGEFTVHGMRSAARSWMADNGVEFELAEACLAHTVGNAVVQAYQRSSMLERRRPLMQAWADFVTGATGDNDVRTKRRVRAPLRRA